MRLEIRQQGIEIDDEAQSHIERRLLFALGRFSPRIQRVTVYLADLNGPKGARTSAAGSSPACCARASSQSRIGMRN